MNVFEEVYEDELPAGTHVMSGRWVDTMKTPTMWRSKYKEFVAGTLERLDNALEVTDKPQEFLGRSLCWTPQGYTFGVSSDYVTKLCKDFGFGELKGSNTLSFEKPDDNDTILDESGQRRHRQLLGRLLWLDRPDIKNAVCQLSTHFGPAITRDEININPACNMVVGCTLDVLGFALRKVRSW